jgi:hypothetical protein
MEDAISNKDTFAYYELCVQFIEMALFPLYRFHRKLDWNKVAWNEVIEVFSIVSQINSPQLDFPILVESKKRQEKLPWEYKGRDWYFWLNLFATSYGWDSDTVSILDIDTAIGLYQELQIDSQLDREWWWGLSEISYPYNSSTKKSEFKALERPDWMKPIAQAPKKVKIHKDMMPLGNVINLDEEEMQRREAKRAS